jgi:hypothetical protein
MIYRRGNAANVVMTITDKENKDMIDRDLESVLFCLRPIFKSGSLQMNFIRTADSE